MRLMMVAMQQAGGTDPGINRVKGILRNVEITGSG